MDGCNLSLIVNDDPISRGGVIATVCEADYNGRMSAFENFAALRTLLLLAHCFSLMLMIA